MNTNATRVSYLDSDDAERTDAFEIVTLSSLKQYLRHYAADATEDDTFNSFIASSGRLMEQHSGVVLRRALVKCPYLLSCEGTWGAYYRLPTFIFPIHSISSFTFLSTEKDGDDVSLTSEEIADIRIVNSILLLPYHLYAKHAALSNCEIEFVAGYDEDAVPADVANTMMRTVMALDRNRDADPIAHNNLVNMIVYSLHTYI